MWAKRIGAVVAAIALIGGAVVLRRAVDGGSGGGGSSSTDPPAGKTAVVCIPELEAACRALAAADDGLALTIEPAGATYERVVADPDSAPAVWVTLDPWPQMVSSAVAWPARMTRSRPRAAVAIVRAVMVGRNARMMALAGHWAAPSPGAAWATPPGSRGPTWGARRPGGC